jgi:hypothetical protein
MISSIAIFVARTKLRWIMRESAASCYLNRFKPAMNAFSILRFESREQ